MGLEERFCQTNLATFLSRKFLPKPTNTKLTVGLRLAGSWTATSSSGISGAASLMIRMAGLGNQRDH